jgi:predicted regulator of Ras-like GTPase activity (Roadblock/LC7/MglB family)
VKPKNYRRKAPRRVERAELPPPPDPLAEQVVAQVRAALPELLAVAVVEVASGASLAAHATTTAIDPATGAAFNAQVVKLKQQAMAALQLPPDEQLGDILITLSSQLHLLQLTPDGRRFIYLVVASDTTNLGIAREVLRAQVGQLAA